MNKMKTPLSAHMRNAGRIRNRGFTLIELLVSMGILAIIVLMMARVFTETSNAWSTGTKRVYEAQEGRVIMDFLVQEMSQAIADDLVSFKIHSTPNPPNSDSLSVSAYGLESDSICFVAATRPPPYSTMLRAVPHYMYFVDYMTDFDGNPMDESHPEGPRYRLARLRKTAATHSSPENLARSAYQNPEWWKPNLWREPILPFATQNRETIAENVAGFEVWAAKGSLIEQGEMNPDVYFIEGYDSVDEGEPPLWVDIYLMLLGEPEAIRAADLWRNTHPDREDFVDRSTRRYSARIYFRNREGYSR